MDETLAKFEKKQLAECEQKYGSIYVRFYQLPSFFSFFDLFKGSTLQADAGIGPATF
jgi:hypothetical protein